MTSDARQIVFDNVSKFLWRSSRREQSEFLTRAGDYESRRSQWLGKTTLMNLLTG